MKKSDINHYIYSFCFCIFSFFFLNLNIAILRYFFDHNSDNRAVKMHSC